MFRLEHVCCNHFSAGNKCFQHAGVQEKGHSMMASAFCMASAPESTHTGQILLQENETQMQQQTQLEKQPDMQTFLQWHAPGLTLDYLYGLATSLSPGDTELTPVQAWLELANQYGTARLLDEQVLSVLKRELKDVVRCVFFGAVMERRAFESVVGRVLGPVPLSALNLSEAFM